MRRLILTNKVGKNENFYIVGSGVGKQSRFARKACITRCSNNAAGECCDFNAKDIITGSLIDGYIRNASGMVINIETNKIIELITTDSLGNFTLRTSENVLPNIFKIKFTNGIDIATNLNNILEFEGIFEKREVATKLNVSIMSTLVSLIVENDITDSTILSKLKTTREYIGNLFNLTNNEIKSDHILNKNTKLTKLNNEINNISKTLTSAFISDLSINLAEKEVLNEIGFLAISDNSFNFLDVSYIQQVIDNVFSNKNIIVTNEKKENLKNTILRANTIIDSLSENLSFEDFFIQSTKINVIASNYVNEVDFDVYQNYDAINNIFIDNINTYPINTIYNDRAFSVNYIECVNFSGNLNVIYTLNGNKYVLNNALTYDANKKYGINNGIYEITNIPQSHPLAILNNNKTHQILYTGDADKKVTYPVNDISYDFYYGNINIKVISNFTKVSFYCLYHGYMGGEDILFYNTTCPSPPPIITLNGENNIIREVGFPLNDPGAIALDRNDKVLKVTVTTDLSLSIINNVPIIKETGNFNIIYRAIDNTGSASEKIRTIRVVDTTEPTITLRPDAFGNVTNITVELGDQFTDPGYDASDNNSQPLTVTVTGLEAINTNVKGTYVIEYTATDIDGYSTTETRTVTVEDSVPPELNLIGPNPQIIELGTPFIELGADVFDRSDLSGDTIDLQITHDISLEVSGNQMIANRIGIYVIRYQATDINNKQTIKYREVQVRDTTPPVITLLPDPSGIISPIVLELGQEYTEYGFFTNDILGISDEFHNSNSIDFNVAGTYNVVYTAFDLCNNKSEATRVVIVQDTQAPIITISGDESIIVELGDPFQDPGVEIFDYSSYSLITDIFSVDINNNQTLIQNIDTSIKGNYIIKYTASDSFNNTSIKERSVIVRDSTGPSITLEGSSTIIVQAGDTYIDPGATAVDLGGGNIILTVSGENIDTNVLGVYNVVYKAVDEDQNETFLTRRVEVVDTTKPVVTLIPNNFGLINYTIQAGSDTYIEYGADVTDNYDTNLTLDICYGNAVTDSGTFNSAQVGTYEIKYSATDICGNISDIKTRVITIEDIIAPRIDFEPYPGQNDISQIVLELGTEYVEYGARVTDNTENVNVSITNNIDLTRPGEYSVTYIALDDYGNSSVEFRRVTIQDTTPPVIYLDNSAIYSNFTTIIYIGDSYTYPVATATDNNTRETLFVGDSGKSAVKLDVIGNYNIIYNVQDSNNNATTIVQTISVRDPSAPRITLNGDSTIIVDYGSVYTDPGAVSVDSQDNPLSINTVNDVCTNLIGTYNVTYTSFNGELQSSETRTVIVKDLSPPVLLLSGDISYTLIVGNNFIEPGVIVSDNYDSSDNINISYLYELNGVEVNNLDTNIVGNYIITYTATDTCNNAVSISREVVIIDNIAPTISLVGNSELTMQINQAYNDPGVIVNDNYDNSANITVNIEGNVLTGTVGSYDLSYTAVDTNGNESNTIRRRVFVVNNAPPTISLIDDLSSITVEVNTSFIDSGVIATDNTGAVIESSNILINYSLDGSDVSGIETNIPNRTYTITYTAIDVNDFSSSISRVVEIKDTIVPIIELSGARFINLNYQESYIEPGVTVSDNYDTSDNITITKYYKYQSSSDVSSVDISNIDTNVLGIYTIYYNAIDSNNNISTDVSRQITVEDITPPVITLQGDICMNILVNSIYSEPGYVVSDNYADISDLSINIISDLCTNIVGNYTINYTAIDSEENESTVIRTIIVSDTIAPTVELSGNNPMLLKLFDVFIDPGVIASDNFDSSNALTISISNEFIDTTVSGEHIIYYTVTDNAENVTDISRLVYVLEPPSIDLSYTFVSILKDLSFSYPDVSTNDASGNELILLGGENQVNEISNSFLRIERSNDVSSTNITGSYAILYTVYDNYDISNSRTFNLTINQPQPPNILVFFGSTTLDLSNIDFDYPLVTGSDSYNNTITLSGGIDQLTEISTNNLIIRREGTVDMSTEGSYDLSYSIASVNDSDLSSISVVTFNIVDNTLPTIVISGNNPLYIEQNSSFTAPVADASDNRGTDISDLIIIENSLDSTISTIDTSILGIQILVYKVTDPINNQQRSEILVINILESLSPTLTLIGPSELPSIQFQSYIEAGATALDYDNSDISDLIVINYNDLCMNVLGSYTILYSVTNSVGYTVSAERTVVVSYETINYSIEVLDNGAGGFDLSGSDRNGTLNGTNQTITLQTQDALFLTVTSTNNPFYIRTQQSIDDTYNVTSATNNGATNSIIFWITDTSGTFYYNSSNDINMGGTIIINDHPSLIPTTNETYNITVTAPGFSYSLSGNDRNGAISGTNSTININVGDTLELDVSVSGHPLWIKPVSSTGTSNGVSDPAASNNGATSGTISWTPNNTGTYYYICQYHSSMVGTIIVS